MPNTKNAVKLNTVAFPQTSKRGFKKSAERGVGGSGGGGGGGMSQARTSVPIIRRAIFKTKSAPGSWEEVVSDTVRSAWVTVDPFRARGKGRERECVGDISVDLLLHKERI